jgi:hypothetical protein
VIALYERVTHRYIELLEETGFCGRREMENRRWKMEAAVAKWMGTILRGMSVC